MNVRQLRNLLLDYPGDMDILLSDGDDEYYRMVEMGQMYIFPNDDKHGSTDQIIDPAEVGEGLEYSLNEVEPRLVFWP